MAGGVPVVAGGICGLSGYVTSHEGPLTYDLLDRGLHFRDIGSRRLSWLELRAFLDWHPRDSSSALYRAANPTTHSFHGAIPELLGALIYAVQGADPAAYTAPVEEGTAGPAKISTSQAQSVADEIRADELAARRAQKAS